MKQIQIDPVRDYLMGLQDRICEALEQIDGRASFRRQQFDGERGGLARPRVLEDGAVIEKAAVNFSHSVGQELPAAASKRRPELAGCSFTAVSTSLIVHPVNPYAPTTHMNLRCFLANSEAGKQVWWFGGGFDLTPYYGFVEDAVHWHATARSACAPFRGERHARFKKWCDDYFHLKHRDEARGIGGLFFDDLDEAGFEGEFDFLRSVGDHFLPAYLPILERRKDAIYGQRERDFQRIRRGRYVEFNLVYDRGTLYGLQSGGRIESILASLPPQVSWAYDPEYEANSPEARLVEDFLRPRDWLAEA